MKSQRGDDTDNMDGNIMGDAEEMMELLQSQGKGALAREIASLSDALSTLDETELDQVLEKVNEIKDVGRVYYRFSKHTTN